MSFWVLAQIVFNLLFLASASLLWIRLGKPAKDDPRLSKGLQLLQSKIAVLEDLSDRTEIQVTQLTNLLETKCRELQEKIQAADRQISRIDQSAQKSLEVAKIFQDRIPHSEILERQNTIKYVRAARMAHQGHGVDEIIQQVDLSRGEIELIAKVNRDQLQFSETDLPEWAREAFEDATSMPTTAANGPMSFSLPRENFSQAFEMPQASDSLRKLDQEFRQTIQDAAQQETPAPSMAAGAGFFEIDLNRPDPVRTESGKVIQTQPAPVASKAAPKAAPAPAPSVKTAPKVSMSHSAVTTDGKTVDVRPVVFPRLDLNRDLG